jgi:hypothetical protein
LPYDRTKHAFGGLLFVNQDDPRSHLRIPASAAGEVWFAIIIDRVSTNSSILAALDRRIFRHERTGARA